MGFRPFVYRLACEHNLAGHVINDAHGVRVHAEGDESSLLAFERDLVSRAPEVANVYSVNAQEAEFRSFDAFTIGGSDGGEPATAGISPDLPACDECLQEMLDGADRRTGYPYINCSACGPRFSIICAMPYDRVATTMRDWRMCEACSVEYHDPADRRFHAQPIACSQCGPAYRLVDTTGIAAGGTDAVAAAVARLCAGEIVAIKGIGGYHLACDASNPSAVETLRERKFRKEQPFAVMARNIDVARETIRLSPEAEVLIASLARPIVLGPRLMQLPGVAPDTHEIGVLLPYTPLHHLLFVAGAPERLVMTSGNRSSEPIAYRDDEAGERLREIADVFLVGERPIARRVDDSVARIGAAGPCLLRRSRGYAPRSAVRMELDSPALALGADLKNTIALIVNGEAILSQHIGDLQHMETREALAGTIDDLLAMHSVDRDELQIVHDLHPEYHSTAKALELHCGRRIAVQHHRAHIASVIAERGAYRQRIVGAAFDGTGFGDDGTIWGGEFFVGNVVDGFDRVGHLRQCRIPGGDAAARFPVQAAAGFLAASGIGESATMMREPFLFPERYARARGLLEADVRCFASTSAGRLFDAVAALLGFTRESTYEGQAAMWLENLARKGRATIEMEIPFTGGELDFRPAMASIVAMRERSVNANAIARAFHQAMAEGISAALMSLANEHSVDTAVLSGGVFQNDLLLSEILGALERSGMRVWTNNVVPPNDGGICLGQAAMTLSSR